MYAHLKKECISDATDVKKLTVSIAITSRYKRKGYGRNMLIKVLGKKNFELQCLGLCNEK